MTIETQLRHADPGTLVTRLTELQAMKLDMVKHTSSLRSVDGKLVVTDQMTDHGVGAMLEMGDTFFSGLATFAGIPTNYLRQIVAEERRRQAEHPLEVAGAIVPGAYSLASIFDMTVNYWLDRANRKVTVRAYMNDEGEGLARAMLSDKYRIIDSLDVIMAVFAGIQKTGREVKCTGADLTDRNMFVRFSCPDVAVDGGEFVRGYRHNGRSGADLPLMFAGFLVRNSEIGGGAMEIVPRLEVQVCSNGQVRNVDKRRNVHLGGQRDEGEIDWSDESEDHYMALIKSRTADAVEWMLSPEYVAQVVDQINERASTRIERPDKAIDFVAKKFAWPEAQREAVLAAFIASGQSTVGGLVQGITAAAQSMADGDTAHTLESDAEKVLEVAGAVAAA